MAEVRTSPRRQVVHPNRPTAGAQTTTVSKPLVEREKLVKVGAKRPLETRPGTIMPGASKPIETIARENEAAALKKSDEQL
jgi:hypothetical protein